LLRGFAVLRVFLRGVLEKVGVSKVVFGGDFVVNLWWERGFGMVVFRGQKNATFLKFFLWKYSEQFG